MDCQSADGSNLIKLWEKGLRAVKTFGVRKGEPPRSKAPSPNELGEGAGGEGWNYSPQPLPKLNSTCNRSASSTT
jgi:hypothetical protein